jgi:hypothetical protein
VHSLCADASLLAKKVAGVTVEFESAAHLPSTQTTCSELGGTSKIQLGTPVERQQAARFIR